AYRGQRGSRRVVGPDPPWWVSRLSEGKLARWRRRHVGFIFQFYNLIPVLTAFENVELPLALRRSSRAARRKRVETALSVVGLQNRMKHYPRQLSGGQEQRVAIARAIVTDPTLLLADEPTGDLDADSGREVLDLLGQLNERFNKTILMVTHDPTAAARARRLLRLHRGRLVSSEVGAGR
ncbi:MAG: ATP-binding cassette domain-containing protein, partial [Chloroflexi bacterium]|nr:ATP-binding cassette domain-containing protein [Chloroflexota bacterium]